MAWKYEHSNYYRNDGAKCVWHRISSFWTAHGPNGEEAKRGRGIARFNSSFEARGYADRKWPLSTGTGA